MNSYRSHTLPRENVTGSIRLYCGVSERTWNGHPVSPGAYACVSPVSGKSTRTLKETFVHVPKGVQVIQDSGAFSDSWVQRLSFQQAVERQESHAQKHNYDGQITHRATYDLLIDEVWHEGNRSKRRWSETDAEEAVTETIHAAQWLDQHRNGLSLIISGQGVNAAQYLRCVDRLLTFFRDGDILGLGGWCIIGKMSRQMMPVFKETVRQVIPFVAKQGIKRVHIWGVIYPSALSVLLKEAVEQQVTVSTDSMGPCLQPAFGQWGYGSWRNNQYQRPPLHLLGPDRIKHAALTRQWLDSFATSVDYVTVHPSVCHASQLESVTRACAVCGRSLAGRRQHAKTCGDTCRKALSRL